MNFSCTNQIQMKSIGTLNRQLPVLATNCYVSGAGSHTFSFGFISIGVAQTSSIYELLAFPCCFIEEKSREV